MDATSPTVSHVRPHRDDRTLRDRGVQHRRRWGGAIATSAAIAAFGRGVWPAWARVAAACAILISVLVAEAWFAATARAQMPAGAQTVSETYQDWQMICAQPQGIKRCVVSQQQTDGKTNQRVLAVELQPFGDKADGMLALPFGLLLDKGAALKIGDADLGSVLRFKTCVPQGCIVPVSFDTKALAVLRKASALTVDAAGNNDQPAVFSISLKGFGPALDCAVALAR